MKKAKVFIIFFLFAIQVLTQKVQHELQQKTISSVPFAVIEQGNITVFWGSSFPDKIYYLNQGTLTSSEVTQDFTELGCQNFRIPVPIEQVEKVYCLSTIHDGSTNLMEIDVSSYPFSVKEQFEIKEVSQYVFLTRNVIDEYIGIVDENKLIVFDTQQNEIYREIETKENIVNYFQVLDNGIFMVMCDGACSDSDPTHFFVYSTETNKTTEVFQTENGYDNFFVLENDVAVGWNDENKQIIVSINNNFEPIYSIPYGSFYQPLNKTHFLAVGTEIDILSIKVSDQKAEVVSNQVLSAIGGSCYGNVGCRVRFKNQQLKLQTGWKIYTFECEDGSFKNFSDIQVVQDQYFQYQPVVLSNGILVQAVPYFGFLGYSLHNGQLNYSSYQYMYLEDILIETAREQYFGISDMKNFSLAEFEFHSSSSAIYDYDFSTIVGSVDLITVDDTDKTPGLIFYTSNRLYYLSQNRLTNFFNESLKSSYSATINSTSGIIHIIQTLLKSNYGGVVYHLQFNLSTLEQMGSKQVIETLGSVKKISDRYYFIASQKLSQATTIGVYDIEEMKYVFSENIDNSLQLNTHLPLGFNLDNSSNIIDAVAYYDSNSSKGKVYFIAEKKTEEIEFTNYGTFKFEQVGIDRFAIFTANGGFSRTDLYKISKTQNNIELIEL